MEEGAPFPAALQCRVDAWSERSKPLFQLPLSKIGLILRPRVEDISDIKLIRTDTTLDLSQKAEKRWRKTGARLSPPCGRAPAVGVPESSAGVATLAARSKRSEPALIPNGPGQLFYVLFHNSERLGQSAEPAKNTINSVLFLSTEVFSKRRKTCA